MSAPIIQGWCPGALRPMESGDGYVVRIRPPAGRLSAVQAAGVATLARQHGNGLIDLSGRANMQLRGISAQSHAPLIAGLRALGLVDENIAAEQRRNITLAPFWADGDGAKDMAQALAQLLTRPDCPALSGKFGFALDLGAQPVLRGVAADIRIERAPAGALVYADGATTGVLAPMAEAAQMAMDLAQWFVQTGGVGADGRGRMQAHLAKGAALPAPFTAAPLPQAAPFTAQPGLTPQGALLGLAFGQMQAETLAALAALGPLRITPWRMVLAEGAQSLPQIDGLLTKADDPLLRVLACTGAPACVQAHQPTRALARRLAPHVPEGTLLHISGCAKGCAHPGPAALTLTASPQGFDLIGDGRASDTPAARALPETAFPQALFLKAPF